MMHRSDASARRRGFTIVEVVLSGFVLTVTVLGVAASIATSGGMGDRSREEMRARRAAQSWLAEVQARPIGTVGFTLHEAAFDVTGLQPTTNDTDGRVGRITFSDGPLPHTYYVDVRVAWEGRNGEREVRTRVVLADVVGEGGLPPTMDELQAAAKARLTAPVILREILKVGEQLLQEMPGERWSEAMTLAMEHVHEAQLLLGTTPVELERVTTELEASVTQLETALQNGLDDATGASMIQEVSGVVTALGVG